MSAVPASLQSGPAMRVGDARPGVAGPYALSLIVLVTTPLWIREIGLYQYIAVEIVIWALFALSYNLLLGQAGLPSFGHGAFFGVGAYAFGLTVKQVAPSLWLGLGAALAGGTGDCLAGALRRSAAGTAGGPGGATASVPGVCVAEFMPLDSAGRAATRRGSGRSLPVTPPRRQKLLDAPAQPA